MNYIIWALFDGCLCSDIQFLFNFRVNENTIKVYNKDTLLRDFQRRRIPDLKLEDIENHVIEFSKTREGSM